MPPTSLYYLSKLCSVLLSDVWFAGVFMYAAVRSLLSMLPGCEFIRVRCSETCKGNKRKITVNTYYELHSAQDTMNSNFLVVSDECLIWQMKQDLLIFMHMHIINIMFSFIFMQFYVLYSYYLCFWCFPRRHKACHAGIAGCNLTIYI